MNKIAVSIAVGLLASAVPAAAQYQGGYYGGDTYRGGAYRGDVYRGGQSIERQIAQLQDRIERSADRGRLSPREADRLSEQVRRVAWQYDRYRRDGLTAGEHRVLLARIDAVRDRLRYEREDRDGWDRDDRGWDRRY